MAIRDIFKVSRRTFLNPSEWVGYDTLKEQNTTLWTVITSVFAIAKPEREETFTQALHRLKLSEAEVKATSVAYRRYAYFFLFMAIAVLCYSVFLVAYSGTFFGFILGLCVSVLFLSQAFRYDFWSYQIRVRRLGVSFKEWKQHLLGGNHKAR